jgi:predicted RNA-binding Zn-ribbon protein involved in translation (DUF1610 family)
MIKQDVTVWQCECGNHSIILDKDLKSFKLDIEEILCPLCGNEMISECIKELTIGDFKKDPVIMGRLKEIKNKLLPVFSEDEELIKQYYIFYKEDMKFMLTLLNKEVGRKEG